MLQAQDAGCKLSLIFEGWVRCWNVGIVMKVWWAAVDDSQKTETVRKLILRLYCTEMRGS